MAESEFMRELAEIRRRELAPLRREAGLPEDDEQWNAETIEDGSMMRYVEILEATVCGKASVMTLVARTLIPHARMDTLDD